MKKIYIVTILLLSLSAYTTQAKVFTVSNSPVGVGKYTDVQPAITAASPGDTIYIHGSSVTYNSFTINKRLVVIGAGYNVTGTQNNLSTSVGTVTLDTVSQVSSPSGSYIIGLNITGGINSNSIYFNNIHIQRCATLA